MLIPIRCFTCSKPIANKWELYNQKCKENMNDQNIQEKTLTELGFDRYCCRRMFLTQVDVIDELLLYEMIQLHNE